MGMRVYAGACVRACATLPSAVTRRRGCPPSSRCGRRVNSEPPRQSKAKHSKAKKINKKAPQKLHNSSRSGESRARSKQRHDK